MTELTEYLGNNLMENIKQVAKINTVEFMNQNPSTKLQVANANKYELEIYKSGVHHLINALDDTACENEYLENNNRILKDEVNRIQTKYGEINQEYLEKQKQIIVKQDNTRSHAKRALEKYIKKCEDGQGHK